MATNQDIVDKIEGYLNESYTRTETYGVPKVNDLTFGNSVKKMPHAVVMFIDMRKSRKILSDASDFWSIKIHKSFIRAVTHCLEKRDGHMRSFNGDGILAFFVGENAASRAVKSAMEIKGFVRELNELLLERDLKKVDFGIGIAQGKVQVAKSGKGGDNQTRQDLIWIGLPVYVAVELSNFGRFTRNIWISKHVRSSIGKEKHLNVVYDSEGHSKWSRSTKNLKSVGESTVYGTTFYMNI
jgi:class 3 adenylate cyclase